MSPEKKPGLIESTFVESHQSGRRALDVLRSLESPIATGLREGVKRITGQNQKPDINRQNIDKNKKVTQRIKRDGCPTSKFVEPTTAGDKALKLFRTMESPIAAGLRDGGKNNTRTNLR